MYAEVQLLNQFRIWRRKPFDAYACLYDFGPTKSFFEINNNLFQTIQNLAFGSVRTNGSGPNARFEQIEVT